VKHTATVTALKRKIALKRRMVTQTIIIPNLNDDKDVNQQVSATRSSQADEPPRIKDLRHRFLPWPIYHSVASGAD
jgi:hypothetical protein